MAKQVGQMAITKLGNEIAFRVKKLTETDDFKQKGLPFVDG